jgi:hypothetical protein
MKDVGTERLVFCGKDIVVALAERFRGKSG